MMRIAPGGYASGYCAAMDPVTSLITTKAGNQQYYYWPPYGAAEPTEIAIATNYTNMIRRVSFKEVLSSTVPTCFEPDRIYYARRSAAYTWTITPFGVRIYNTLADALAQTNHITFTSQQVKLNWEIIFVDKVYGGLECAEYGASNIEDIFCCPEPQKYETNLPGGYEVQGFTQSLVGAETWENGNILEYTVPNITLNRILNVYGFQNGIFAGYDTWTLTNIYYLGNYIGYDYFPQSEIITVWYGGVKHFTNPFFKRNIVDYKRISGNVFEYTGFAYWPDFFDGKYPQTLTVNPIGQTNLPAQARLYMPDAIFYDPKYPVHLGTINQVLSLDAKTSTYYGPVMDLYGIPGRIHIKLDNFYPPLGTANPRILHAAEGVYPNGGNFPDTKPLPDNYFNLPVKVFLGNPLGYRSAGIFFDTRVSANSPNVILEKPLIFKVAYSQYNLARGRMAGTLQNADSASVHKTNFYGLVSYHGGCYFSSLEV